MIRGFKQTLWVFDVDGTLSLMVSDREKATIEPACKELLQALAMKFILELGGLAFAVGEHSLISGSRVVRSSLFLAQEICKLAGLKGGKGDCRE